ncbi:hypothetical protein [Sphingobacterium cellulitidis]|uniref:hypothetical protein n=1 Tax=Sphingobacterium cellulitidis TaxID=1768011 RepID=UPI000B93A18C|nr:hypothetical protein CHT99_01280 [Sphingobacterium cellulitidis]
MYRKTPSDPASHAGAWDGLLDRMRRTGTSCRRLVERYPVHFFAGMVVCMLCSGILAFSVMRVGTPHTLPAFSPPPSGGAVPELTGIIDTYSAIREVADLQQVIAAIVKKDTLSAADSILLTDALRRFELIQRSISTNDKNNPAP